MRFTIYGAGAIGGSLGAYMVRAGEDVLFVDKSEDHVNRMKKEGLKVDGFGGEVIAQVKAVSPGELRAPLEVRPACRQVTGQRSGCSPAFPFSADSP